MNNQHELRFQLYIASDEFTRYYRGEAKEVIVRTENGLTLSLPASAFQPFVSHHGIEGKFVVKFDQHNKLLSLQRVV